MFYLNDLPLFEMDIVHIFTNPHSAGFETEHNLKTIPSLAMLIPGYYF